ncbi:uncharacterized protein LOC106145337 isoform X2 [Ictidomys tridecemlineatus]
MFASSFTSFARDIVAFMDVTVNFPQKDWGLLESCSEDLVQGGDENFDNLVSLGFSLISSEFADYFCRDGDSHFVSKWCYLTGFPTQEHHLLSVEGSAASLQDGFQFGFLRSGYWEVQGQGSGHLIPGEDPHPGLKMAAFFL